MRLSKIVITLIAMTTIGGASGVAAQENKVRAATEPYVQELLPPEVRVIGSEVDGSLFADRDGHPLYTWPARGQNNLGYRGEQPGKPTCDGAVRRTTVGFHRPYPAGLIVPDAEKRPSCTDLWPPFFADDDAKSVGDWTIISRSDGKKQWAYDGYAVYKSALDREPGDVIGSGRLMVGSQRRLIGPKPDVPPQFTIIAVTAGRLLTTVDGFSVYTSAKDSANKSNCDLVCERVWAPVRAHASAPKSRGEWGVIERAPGVFQWTYRQKPLYTLVGEQRVASFHGADNPGWSNVFTQPPPPLPKGFTVQDMPGGQIVADSQGRTVYQYFCSEDGMDQLNCDHPTHVQAYRLAMCGGGDSARCLRQFPYVVADAKAEPTSRIWSIRNIDPETGRYVEKGTPGGLRIWTYRDRPIYLFYRDQKPGDAWADAWGENAGKENGFRAIYVREEFRKQYSYLDTRSGAGDDDN